MVKKREDTEPEKRTGEYFYNRLKIFTIDEVRVAQMDSRIFENQHRF